VAASGEACFALPANPAFFHSPEWNTRGMRMALSPCQVVASTVNEAPPLLLERNAVSAPQAQSGKHSSRANVFRLITKVFITLLRPSSQ
jgi:hypothetical protein